MKLKIIAGFCLLMFLFISAEQVFAQETTKLTAAKSAKVETMETEKNTFGLSQIGQIAISVNDLERATKFYRDKLGMKYQFTANGMAFFDGEGIRLMLAKLNKTESDHIGSVIYFKVSNIQEAHKTLIGRGVKFDEEPELAAKTNKFTLWLACFKDSENNNLCLMSEVPNE